LAQTTFVYLLNIDMVKQIDHFQNYADFLFCVKGVFLVYVLFAGAFETAAVVCVLHSAWFDIRVYDLFAGPLVMTLAEGTGGLLFLIGVARVRYFLFAALFF
jgi:hypothetical protein